MVQKTYIECIKVCCKCCIEHLWLLFFATHSGWVRHIVTCIIIISGVSVGKQLCFGPQWTGDADCLFLQSNRNKKKKTVGNLHSCLPLSAFLPLCLSSSFSLCQRSNQRYFQCKRSALVNQNIFGEDPSESFYVFQAQEHYGIKKRGNPGSCYGAKQPKIIHFPLCRDTWGHAGAHLSEISGGGRIKRREVEKERLACACNPISSWF